MRLHIVNGRRVDLPEAATPEEIAKAADIRAGRRIIRQRREGNYPMPAGERMPLGEDDKFVDAPQRVKGNCTGHLPEPRPC
jgi:hypothetical protein